VVDKPTEEESSPSDWRLKKPYQAPVQEAGPATNQKPFSQGNAFLFRATRHPQFNAAVRTGASHNLVSSSSSSDSVIEQPAISSDVT
jgi:hypothetical protein